MNKNKKYLRLNITYKCDLGCSYCVSNKKPRCLDKDSLIEVKGAEWYLKRIDALLKGIDTSNLEIDLKGEGDVLQSKEFPKVLQWALYRGYPINLQTNLQGYPRLEKAIEFVSLEKRKTILVSSSYHLGAYLDKPNPDKWRLNWMNMFRRLAKSGMTVGKVDIPLSPKILTDDFFEGDLMIIKKWGGRLNPALLVGTYLDKPYPKSYTDKEKERVEHILKTYKKNYLYIDNWKSDQIAHVEHRLHLKGMLCDYLTKRVDVMADGKIRYCQTIPRWFADFTLFNIDPDKLSTRRLFKKEPGLCPNEICGCQSLGVAHCLKLNNITIQEYFEKYYKDKKEISEKFKNV